MDYYDELDDEQLQERMPPRYVRVYRAETGRGVVFIVSDTYAHASAVLAELGHVLTGRMTNGPEDWINTRSSGHMMRVSKYA